MTNKYKTLNDCETHEAFRAGNTEIWYQKAVDHNAYWIDPDNLEKTHVLLGKIAGIKPIDDPNTLEGYFMLLQGEMWSPNGEAGELVSRLMERPHTSISVGDIIFVAGKTYFVDGIGFKLLTKPVKVYSFLGIIEDKERG